MSTDLDPIVQADLGELERALAGEPSRFSALVADVRATRPAMTTAFQAELDAKIDAARSAPPRRPRWLAWSPLGLAAAAVVAVVIALSGGGGGSSTTGATSVGSAGSAKSAAPSVAGEQAAPAPRAPSAIAPTARKVERSTALALSTARSDVQSVADDVIATAQRFGGIVESSQINTSDAEASAEFMLRIPTAKLDDAVAALSKLAHVASLSQGSTDITGAFVSAAGRLHDARAERAALLKALGRATTTAQIDALKLRLRDNRSQIAAIKGELNALRHRANLSQVQVSVAGNGHKGAGGGHWTPADAARDALRVLEIAAGVLLIALAVSVPLALVFGAAMLGARGTRRRRRESGLDAV